MSQNDKDKGAEWVRQTTAGTLLIAAGVILFLVQLGTIEVVSIWQFWPVALIVVGLMKLVTPPAGRDLAAGALELVIGLWCLACNLHWFGFTYWETWPFVFVAVGANMVIKALVSLDRKSRPAGESEDSHA